MGAGVPRFALAGFDSRPLSMNDDPNRGWVTALMLACGARLDELDFLYARLLIQRLPETPSDIVRQVARELTMVRLVMNGGGAGDVAKTAAGIMSDLNSIGGFPHVE